MVKAIVTVVYMCTSIGRGNIFDLLDSIFEFLAVLDLESGGRHQRSHTESFPSLLLKERALILLLPVYSFLHL